VIGKICPRGENIAGLIRYLYGPGRREEHTDPHIVAGYRHSADLEPALRPDGGRDFRRLVGLLRLPHDVLGKWGYAKPVWHCSMRAAPEDRLLSDDEWAQIAHDVMDRTGLSRYGEEDDAVRWIAIRHGPDHIHIVAMLARQDRTRPSTWNDRYRVRDACLAAEERYGLRSTAPADRTADRCPTRAEQEKSARRGMSEPPRIILRRHVATAAAATGSAEEFFARIDQAGVHVRLRYSTRNTGEVTGFSVALPADTTKDGKPVWYGGGKLAGDLSWPKLRQRWTTPSRQDPALSAEEVRRLWDHAARVTAQAAEQIRSSPANSPDAADAAYAAADALRVTAAALGSRILWQAADAFDRAARQPHGHIPAPTPVGRQLRQAARIISAYAYLTHDRTFAPLVLIIRLAALAEAIAELRQTQQRAAQAAAALRAARHLDAISRQTAPAPPGSAAEPAPEKPQAPTPESEASRFAAQSFPSSPFGSGRFPAGQPSPDQDMPRLPRRPSPPRPRGPTRLARSAVPRP
jgi:hypothetical protein